MADPAPLEPAKAPVMRPQPHGGALQNGGPGRPKGSQPTYSSVARLEAAARRALFEAITLAKKDLASTSIGRRYAAADFLRKMARIEKAPRTQRKLQAAVLRPSTWRPPEEGAGEPEGTDTR